jgi:hypothetical protein
MRCWRISNNIIASSTLKEEVVHQLTKEERARIQDGSHQIQSATDSLSQIDPAKIPGLEAIEDCLEHSDKTLRDILRGKRSPKTTG